MNVRQDKSLYIPAHRRTNITQVTAHRWVPKPAEMSYLQCGTSQAKAAHLMADTVAHEGCLHHSRCPGL